jgi:hypothetical protein
LFWDRTRAAAVGNQRQIAWAMAMPFRIPPKQLYLRRWSQYIIEFNENRRIFRENYDKGGGVHLRILYFLEMEYLCSRGIFRKWITLVEPFRCKRGVHPYRQQEGIKRNIFFHSKDLETC